MPRNVGKNSQILRSQSVSKTTYLGSDVMVVVSSLRSKRFRASSSRTLGREQKKKKRNDWGGGGERRKRLPANPTILKNCVRPRTQLLIGAVLVVLIK